MPDRSARILLVDDEQSIQTLLSYPLRKEGYDVVQATDGNEALERFGDGSFDLVVLDLMLPGIDGLEVCRRLRASSDVPVIMLTARGEETDRVAGLVNGADDYVTKPFSPRELAMRVRSVLRRARGAALADKPGEPDQTNQGILSDRDVIVDLAAHEGEADGEGEQGGGGREHQPEPLASSEVEGLIAALRDQDVGHTACSFTICSFLT